MRRLCRDDVPSTETPSRRAGRKRRFSEQGTWDEGAAAGEQGPPGSSGRMPPRPGPRLPDPSARTLRVSGVARHLAARRVREARSVACRRHGPVAARAPSASSLLRVTLRGTVAHEPLRASFPLLGVTNE